MSCRLGKFALENIPNAGQKNRLKVSDHLFFFLEVTTIWTEKAAQFE